jgi:small-conductance mechanosensitive channel
VTVDAPGMNKQPATAPGPHPGTAERDPSRPGPLRLLRTVDARTAPAVKWAVPSLVVAFASFGVGSGLGGIRRSTAGRFDVLGWRFQIPGDGMKLLALALTAVFAVAGVMASRSIARQLASFSSVRGGASAGSAVRLVLVVVGYLMTGLAVLSLMQVNLGNLLLGGAITGVVIGIAAQQTLGNFFAGLVLLFARPYVAGQRVKIRSGAMGGPFEGVIVGADLIYTTIDTADGLVKMPNAGVLGAAIGPAQETEPAAVPG